MFPRHLLAIRLSHHVVAHGDQYGVEVLARGSQVPHERTGIRRVATSPIRSDVARLSREADQRARAALDGAIPRPISGDGEPTALTRLRTSGLSRQASKKRRLVLASRSIV